MAGTTIGVITYKVVEDHLEKIRKPVSVETGVFTTVSFATFDVLNRVKGIQTFITCCDPSNTESLEKGRIIYIENGRIR